MKPQSFRFFSFLTFLLVAAAPLVPAQAQNLYDWSPISRLGPTALRGQSGVVPPAFAGQGERLTADAAGNVVVAGVYDPDVFFTTPTLAYVNSVGPLGAIRNGYLAKYTSAGVLAWSLNLSGNGDMGIYDVGMDAAGNAYLLGSYAQQLRIDNTVVALANTAQPCFLAKISPTGAVLWAINVEPDISGNRINLERLATDALGNCVVQGNFATRITFNGTVYDGGGSRAHVFVARYNSLGALVGAFAGYATAGTAQDHGYTGVGLTSTGEVYISGWVAPTSTLQFGALPALTGPSTANAKGFVVKISSANTASWLLATTGPPRQSTAAASGQSVDAIAVGPQDRCYATGIMVGSSLAMGTQTLSTGNPAAGAGRDLFVARIAPSGAVESLVGGGGTGKSWGFAVSPQGQAVLGISGGFAWGSVSLPGAVWPASTTTGLVQLDATGAPQRGWQTGLSISAPALAVGGLNLPVLAGTVGGPNPFVFGTQQYTSPYAWNTLIARTTATPLAARLAAQVPGLEVYPNPAQHLVEVRTAQPGPTQITVLDALGRTVRTQRLAAGQTRVELAGLAPGSYTLQVQQGAARSFRQLVVAP